MKKLLACICASLLISSVHAAQESIYYKGQEIVQTETGFTIIPDNEKLIILSNYPNHYSLVLPFSKEWKFVKEKNPVLNGHAGPINLTLKIYESEASPEAILKNIKDKALSSLNAVQADSAELLTHRGQNVLKTVVQGEKIDKVFKGVKHVNFFAVKKWQNIVYQYHLSKVISPKEGDDFNEKDWLNYMTIGFDVNFARD